MKIFHLHNRLREIINNWSRGLSVLFKSLKIRYKFFISFSVIFFLSMLLCNLFIYTFIKKNIEANIESKLNNTTQMILNMVKTSLLLQKNIQVRYSL